MIKKATIFNWENGVTTLNRANSVEELNAGFSMIKNFDIYTDPKKIIPVGEFQRWNTEAEELYGFKGLGSSLDTFFATGKARKNWYGNSWEFRVKITPDFVDTNYSIFNLTNMPANFWDNVQSAGQDIRITDEDNIFVRSDILSIDIDAETGWIVWDNSSTPPYFYLYYGNSTVDGINEGFNTN